MQSPSSSSSSSSSRVPGYSPSDYSPSAMHHHPGHHPPPSSHHHALSAASAGSHHHPPPPAHPHQSVFDHPHLAHYAASGLHHLPSAAAAYPQLHHGLHTSAASSTQAGHPQSHYSHHHHHLPPHLKRDIHLDSSLGGSSDEEHLGDVKPPGLGSSSATSSGVGGSAEAGSGSLRGGGGRGGGLKSPGDASGGKKTKGRVKIKMEFIDNKLRRYTTFSKRKTGIMKKAYELSTLTGTQVMLLVASETGHVYTFATRKLQPMITSDAGKALIQTCLNSPDPLGGPSGGDQRMSATGYEETELTYNVSADEESQKILDEQGNRSGSEEDENEEDEDEPEAVQPPPPVAPLPPSFKKRPPPPKRAASKQMTFAPKRKRKAGEDILNPPAKLIQPPRSISSHTSRHHHNKTNPPLTVDEDSNEAPLNMVTSYITSHPPHPSTSAVLKKEIILKPLSPKKDSGG